MVEPTETESRETLDGLAEAFRRAHREAHDDPQILHEAPVTTPVRRLDEARAARQLKLRWDPADQSARATPGSRRPTAAPIPGSRS